MCPCMQTACVKATRPGVHARIPCAFSEGCMVLSACPQTYAVQAAARPATARACLCEDPLVYSTKCGKSGITRRGSFCSGWSRAGAAHATGAGDTLAPVLALPPPSPPLTEPAASWSTWRSQPAGPWAASEAHRPALAARLARRPAGLILDHPGPQNVVWSNFCASKDAILAQKRRTRRKKLHFHYF